MAQSVVGVRELKAQLSKYLRQVKAGRSFIVTEHGKAVGRLVPTAQSLGEKLSAMIDSGRADWNGRRPEPLKPVARAKRGHSLAEMLLEDRR